MGRIGSDYVSLDNSQAVVTTPPLQAVIKYNDDVFTVAKKMKPSGSIPNQNIDDVLKEYCSISGTSFAELKKNGTYDELKKMILDEKIEDKEALMLYLMNLSRRKVNKYIIDSFKSQKLDYELSKEELENALFWHRKIMATSNNSRQIKDSQARLKLALSAFDIEKKYFDSANSRVKSIFPPPVCEKIGAI